MNNLAFKHMAGLAGSFKGQLSRGCSRIFTGQAPFLLSSGSSPCN